MNRILPPEVPLDAPEGACDPGDRARVRKQFEWTAHEPVALKEGLDPKVLDMVKYPQTGLRTYRKRRRRS